MEICLFRFNPLSTDGPSGEKVGVRVQYNIPYQFSMDTQRQLVGSFSVEDGAQVNILFLGEENNSLLVASRRG